MNPLLTNAVSYNFAAIRPEHVTPAMTQLLAEANAALERSVGPDVADDYDALSAVLDVAVERLHDAWGQVSHLQSVADTPELRAAHAENLGPVIEFSTRLGADARLYAKYKRIAASPVAKQLNAERQKALADALRDFVLGGAELEGAARERYAAIAERAGDLSQQFGDHLLDATDAFSLKVSPEQLQGVPDDVRQATADVANAANAADAADSTTPASHTLTLQAPCYLPVMQFASNRELRETLYRAYATRASELGPKDLDNSALMQELVALREEEAALLGHANYAQMALVPKMARTPTEVLSFVRDLAQRAKPFAEKELAELRAFAAKELGLTELQAWDRAFASERLKQAQFNFSSQEVKQYFTEPRVLQGLFDLIEKLFGVQIRADNAPVWHPSVRYFRVWRSSEAIAAFYLDPYARPAKQGGAWMDGARTRWRKPRTSTSTSTSTGMGMGTGTGTGAGAGAGNSLQLPVAHLVCNFAPPVGDQPALLTHDDVVTLFHEFGHGLHHMLTQVEELAVAGISGVEGDAVELPSQFMENFCWEWELLQTLTAHVDTGQPLPRVLFDRMLAARHFQSGLHLLRQCEFALFDMRLHSEAGAAQRVMAICDETNAEVQPMRAPAFLRFPHSFGHIFDGGYAAGYYGYAWAEVLSADAYAAFEESGVFNIDTGQRFAKEILAVGGSRPALENFVAFRGREPNMDALLRHQGLLG
jgi:oligopeptidase A